MAAPEDPPPGLWRTIWQSWIEEEKFELRVGRAGAVAGAIIGGVWAYGVFGPLGVLSGVAVGALVGFVAIYLLYQLY